MTATHQSYQRALQDIELSADALIAIAESAVDLATLRGEITRWAKAIKHQSQKALRGEYDVPGIPVPQRGIVHPNGFLEVLDHLGAHVSAYEGQAREKLPLLLGEYPNVDIKGRG